MTLDQLKIKYREYRIGLTEWSRIRDAEQVNSVITESGTPEGGMALEILEVIPSDCFSEGQLDSLGRNLSLWIEGPSRYYGLAIRVLVRHSAILLKQLEVKFENACKSEDDSAVRGYCHLFSLMDVVHQTAIKESVKRAVKSSNPDVREAILDLISRCRVFDLDSGL